MIKKLTIDEISHAEVFGRRITALVKLLDMRDASMLLSAYRLYPKDIENDYRFIVEAVEEERFDDVFALLDWYKYKALNDAAAARGEGLLPKDQLSIFLRTAQRPVSSSKLFAEKLD